jgi:cardiolipin-specific phospholipase
MQITRLGRQWWTQSDPSMLMTAQERLFQLMVPQRTARSIRKAGMNAVAFKDHRPVRDDTRPTCVLAHGFGSGLGFFCTNVENILASGKYKELILVDWLGMGGSERPACWNRPYRSMFQCASWCDSHFTTDQSVNFFIDPLEMFLDDNGITGNTHLVGHSLGGYLAARYGLKYPDRLSKLVLASPVGFPFKPSNAFTSSQMPTSMRLIDSLWSSNVTPQSLVRVQGSTRGRRNVKRALRGRISGLSPEHAAALAEYLYHITVAHPSGEFAMNSLLEPGVSPDLMGVFAREPLEDRLLELDPKIELRVSYGDSDWMRSNEPSARKVVDALGRGRARLDVIEKAGHHMYLDNNHSFVSSILT